MNIPPGWYWIAAVLAVLFVLAWHVSSGVASELDNPPFRLGPHPTLLDVVVDRLVCP